MYLVLVTQQDRISGSFQKTRTEVAAIDAYQDRLVPIFRFHRDLRTFSNGSCGLVIKDPVVSHWVTLNHIKHDQNASKRYEYVRVKHLPNGQTWLDHFRITNPFWVDLQTGLVPLIFWIITVPCNEPRALSPHESMSAVTFSCNAGLTCPYLRRIQLSTAHLADSCSSFICVPQVPKNISYTIRIKHLIKP